jgi:hypothetical protein
MLDTCADAPYALDLLIFLLLNPWEFNLLAR